MSRLSVGENLSELPVIGSVLHIDFALLHRSQTLRSPLGVGIPEDLACKVYHIMLVRDMQQDLEYYGICSERSRGVEIRDRKGATAIEDLEFEFDAVHNAKTEKPC